MTIDEEWNEYFGGAAFKSEHTVKSYKNSHKRITSYIGKPKLERESQHTSHII